MSTNYNEETEQQLNMAKEYMLEYSSGFISGLYTHGIVDSITAEKLNTMFSNYDYYQSEIDDLIQYFYITNAEVRQLFEMVEVLPSMSHRIDAVDSNDSSSKQITKLNKHLRKIKHKRLSRDITKQVVSSGTVVGIWLGNKSSPFPYVFDDVKMAFPVARNYYGEWVCVLDLAWFCNLNKDELTLYFDTFKTINLKNKYEDYQRNVNKNRYLQLPIDRTFCIGTGKLKRNQANGTSWATSGLFDVLHKKKLKDLEQALANKIINAVAILTVGSDKLEGKYSNEQLPRGVKQKIHTGVKSALEKKQLGGVSVVTIPEYASLEFEDVNVSGIGGDKFNTVNSDIKFAYGISGGMGNGEGTNYAIAKLNLDIFYKRLAVILEDIEDEVYAKLFNLMLPSNQSDNYYMIYDKEAPINKTERLAGLKGLTDKGWSIRHYVEELGIGFTEYLNETIYETEDLQLQQKIIPYLSSHTASGDDIAQATGRPTTSDSDVTNENTVRTRQSDAT